LQRVLFETRDSAWRENTLAKFFYLMLARFFYKESTDRIYIIEESKIDSHASQFSAIRSIKIVSPVPQFIETESIKILQLYKKRRNSTSKTLNSR